uniref:Uncharacterized protein n=1 Tax=Glossina pallidipes TaxID=7398 RepID=A0A1A9Z5Y5_GLOPL
MEGSVAQLNLSITICKADNALPIHGHIEQQRPTTIIHTIFRGNKEITLIAPSAMYWIKLIKGVGATIIIKQKNKTHSPSSQILKLSFMNANANAKSKFYCSKKCLPFGTYLYRPLKVTLIFEPLWMHIASCIKFNPKCLTVVIVSGTVVMLRLNFLRTTSEAQSKGSKIKVMHRHLLKILRRDDS